MFKFLLRCAIIIVLDRLLRPMYSVDVLIFFLRFQFQFFWCIFNVPMWSDRRAMYFRLGYKSNRLLYTEDCPSTAVESETLSAAVRSGSCTQQQQTHSAISSQKLSIFCCFFFVVLFCECYLLLSRWTSVIWRSVFIEQVAGAWNESIACFVGF